MRADRDPFKVAILDLYDGVDNQGMRCLREILNQFGEQQHLDLVRDEFEVRQRLEIPDLSYDAYIFTGGPGSPVASKGSEWEAALFRFIKRLELHNQNPARQDKKPVFFICHSFQLACRCFKAAEVSQRKSTAFGVFPVHNLADAAKEPIFQDLHEPFYAVDSRDYQVTMPDHNRLSNMGGRVLSIEKERPHVPLERAIMAMRFNEYMVGTQFHPEADAIGMLLYLQTPARKQIVVNNHGEEKWQSMVDHLGDPDKIAHTYAHILPNFLNEAVLLHSLVS